MSRYSICGSICVPMYRSIHCRGQFAMAAMHRCRRMRLELNLATDPKGNQDGSHCCENYGLEQVAGLRRRMHMHRVHLDRQTAGMSGCYRMVSHVFGAESSVHSLPKVLCLGHRYDRITVLVDHGVMLLEGARIARSGRCCCRSSPTACIGLCKKTVVYDRLT